MTGRALTPPLVLTLSVARRLECPGSHPDLRAKYPPKRTPDHQLARGLYNAHRLRNAPLFPQSAFRRFDLDISRGLLPGRKLFVNYPVTRASCPRTVRNPPCRGVWVLSGPLPNTSADTQARLCPCREDTSYQLLQLTFATSIPVNRPVPELRACACSTSATVPAPHPIRLHGSDTSLSTDAPSSRCRHPQPRVAVWLVHTRQRRLCLRPPEGATDLDPRNMC